MTAQPPPTKKEMETKIRHSHNIYPTSIIERMICTQYLGLHGGFLGLSHELFLNYQKIKLDIERDIFRA